jgi:AGCS family alanine or glycine:cation symporter
MPRSLHRLLLAFLLVFGAHVVPARALVAQSAQTPTIGPADTTATGQSPTGVLPQTQDPASPVNAATEPPADSLPEARQGDLMNAVDGIMGRLNAIIGAFFFFDLLFWDDEHTLPFIVAWLVTAAIFLTVKMGFINFRGFRHAINVTRGRYTDPSAPGDVSHFSALSTALSATVGLGNIAGVAIAIGRGGPGATFWMIVAGLLGMTSKFAECTLGQMYRERRSDGTVLGGGMQYLSRGFAEKGMPGLGKFLAFMFAILCVGGSFGGGNSFQVNQSLNAMQETVPFLAAAPWIYGLVMATLTGIVIIGGIKRIANVADKIVPIMCLLHIVGALFIIAVNLPSVPHAFAEIIRQAFNPDAVYGGILGTLVIGFQRAAFSNEAGAGSAAIAHSAAKTDYPVREGIVALLEPFIDTVIVCTMTALVIVITGAYNNPEYADLIVNNKGAALTSRAMGQYISWYPYVLSIIVFMFAFSTMISWSYYGERCWTWMFGDGSGKYYKVLFLMMAFAGSIITSTNVLDFGDLMILGMAFPNLIGVYFLSGKVKAALDDYWAKNKAGEFRVYDKSAAVPAD